MKCSKCRSWNDKVTNSRINTTGICVKRRRECLDCGFRYTTREYEISYYEKMIKQNRQIVVSDEE